jgi:hypothetical protein
MGVLQGRKHVGGNKFGEEKSVFFSLRKRPPEYGCSKDSPRFHILGTGATAPRSICTGKEETLLADHS